MSEQRAHRAAALVSRNATYPRFMPDSDVRGHLEIRGKAPRFAGVPWAAGARVVVCWRPRAETASWKFPVFPTLPPDFPGFFTFGRFNGIRRKFWPPAGRTRACRFVFMSEGWTCFCGCELLCWVRLFIMCVFLDLYGLCVLNRGFVYIASRFYYDIVISVNWFDVCGGYFQYVCLKNSMISEAVWNWRIEKLLIPITNKYNFSVAYECIIARTLND